MNFGRCLLRCCRRRCGRRHRLLARNGDPQTKLEFGLCSAEERLVDLGLVGVQGDVRSSRVGVALKENILVLVECEDSSELGAST